MFLLSYLKYVKTILHVQKDLYQMYVNYTSFMETGINRLFSRFLPVHFSQACLYKRCCVLDNISILLEKKYYVVHDGR